MSEQRKVPKLRFPEFTEDWEQRKLGDLGTTYTGLSGKTSSDFGHGEARFVTYMNVYSNPVANPNMIEPVEIDKKQNEVNVGDVFFTTSSETPEEVGMSSVLLEKQGHLYLNSFCFGYRPKQKIDPYYLAFMLRSEPVRKKIIFLAQGISRYNISKNKMMEICVPLPSLGEQKKIGNFCKNLDELITLHQRKCDVLKKLKQGLLQKMFPKDGTNIPEIRFPEFTDAWEQRKLEDIVNIYDGVHQTPQYKNSGVMFLSVEDITTLKSDKYISEDDFRRDYKVYPEQGDILMTRIGDIGTPNVVVSTEKIAFYVSLALLKLKKGAPFFLCYAIQTPTFHNELLKHSLTTAIPMKINKDEIGKVDIFISSNLDEQKKIGDFFRNIDNLITLHQRKLEVLKKLKKGLLQQMFV